MQLLQRKYPPTRWILLPLLSPASKIKSLSIQSTNLEEKCKILSNFQTNYLSESAPQQKNVRNPIFLLEKQSTPNLLLLFAVYQSRKRENFNCSDFSAAIMASERESRRLLLIEANEEGRERERRGGGEWRLPFEDCGVVSRGEFREKNNSAYVSKLDWISFELSLTLVAVTVVFSCEVTSRIWWRWDRDYDVTAEQLNAVLLPFCSG